MFALSTQFPVHYISLIHVCMNNQFLQIYATHQQILIFYYIFAHHPQSSCSVVTCEIVRKDPVGAVLALAPALLTISFQRFHLMRS